MRGLAALLLVGLSAACGRVGFDALDADPRLATLEVRAGGQLVALAPVFDSDRGSYQVDVELAVGAVDLVATPIDPRTTVTIDSPTPIQLALGPTTISVTGTAEDGETATYTVTVTRAAALAQSSYLKASNTGPSDVFGLALAMSGDTLVVGAPQEDGPSEGVTDSGAVYVFVRAGAVWTEQAYLRASNAEPADNFGIAVAISADTIVVSANTEDSGATGVGGNEADNSVLQSGAVYVYTRSGPTWSQQAYLKASNPEPNDLFGTSVAIAGDTIAVGARGEDSAAKSIDGNQGDNTAIQSGAVYVFARTGSAWAQQAYVKAPNTEAGDLFGDFVALSGDTLVVAALGEDGAAAGINGDQTSNGTNSSGAVYVLERTGTTWSHQAYLKASNPGINDLFGRAIAISGDTVVVGASDEGSAATGVNGNQLDDSAPQAGAAYVFTRTGTTWSQQAYLKASNTEAGDAFGSGATVFGDAIAIGAFVEDGRKGAAYVFARTAGTWAQVSYLKASNPETFDNFGTVVSLSTGGLAVASAGEDSAATGIDGDQTSNAAADSGAVYLFR